MEIFSIIISSVATLIGALGGGIGIFFYRENKRVKAAEAKGAEIDNTAKTNDQWQELVEYFNGSIQQYRELVKEKDAKIEELHQQIFTIEKKCNQLEMQNQSLIWHKCTVNGCTNRRPPRVHDGGEELDCE